MATAERTRNRRPDNSPARRTKTERTSRRTRPGRTPTRQAARPATWSRRVLACAALFSFGTGAALLYLIGELSYHTVDPRQALYYGGAAVCAGVAIGLWLPRQMILRRMRGSSPIGAERSANPHEQARPAGAGQAASLVGGLFLTTGAVLLLLLIGAETAESMRLQLTARFTFPLQFLRALIWIPPLIGLTVAGACVTTALVALHGLHRLVAASRARISELWIVIVAAGALSAFAIPAFSGSGGAITPGLSGLVSAIEIPLFGSGGAWGDGADTEFTNLVRQSLVRRGVGYPQAFGHGDIGHNTT